MLVAFCDQEAGNSTPRCSKAGLSGSPGARRGGVDARTVESRKRRISPRVESPQPGEADLADLLGVQLAAGVFDPGFDPVDGPVDIPGAVRPVVGGAGEAGAQL